MAADHLKGDGHRLWTGTSSPAPGRSGGSANYPPPQAPQRRARRGVNTSALQIDDVPLLHLPKEIKQDDPCAALRAISPLLRDPFQALTIRMPICAPRERISLAIHLRENPGERFRNRPSGDARSPLKSPAPPLRRRSCRSGREGISRAAPEPLSATNPHERGKLPQPLDNCASMFSARAGSCRMMPLNAVRGKNSTVVGRAAEASAGNPCPVKTETSRTFLPTRCRICSLPSASLEIFTLPERTVKIPPRRLLRKRFFPF